MIKFGPFTGMAVKPYAGYLKDSVLQYARDVDFSRNTIAPLRTDRLVNAEAVGNTIYLEDCCLKWYPNCVNIARDPLKCDRYFATEVPGYDYPVHATPDDWCAGNLCRLGWPCPFAAPAVDYDGGVTAEKAEERSYVYTFINQFGEESPPSLPSPLTLVDYTAPATLFGFTEVPPEFCPKYINIYAMVAGVANAAQGTGADTDDYFLVATLDYGTAIFTHLPLTHPIGDSLLTDEYESVPADARDIQHWGSDQIAFISGETIRFTEPRNYSVAPSKYTYLPRSAPIRFVTTNTHGYILNCASPEVVDLQKDCSMSGIHNSHVLNDRYPLIGKLSVATYENGVIFASTEGLVMINITNVGVITSEIFTQDQWDTLQPHTMRGAVHNGCYYGSSDTASFRIELGNGPKKSTTGGFTYLSLRATAWYVTSDNRLLYADENGTHEFGQGDGFRDYEATTKVVDMPGAVNLNAMLLQADCGQLTIEQMSDHKVCFTNDQTLPYKGQHTFRFGRLRGYNFSYTFRGNAEIYSLVASTSIATGRRLG